MRRWCVLLSVFLGITACKRLSEERASEHEMPTPLVVPDAAAIAALSIAVIIDGQPAPPIDHAKLEATKPDFSNDEHRAWKIETLVGPAALRDNVVFTVTGAQHLSLGMPRAKGPQDLLPVLTLNRRGEALAAMVEANDPFPPYHGRGGSHARQGDRTPRIGGVTEIRVGVESPGPDR